MAINQRSDACAVPRGSVVMEAMVALVLADAVLEKFGGDSVAETRRNAQAYLDAPGDPMSGPGAGEVRPVLVLVGPPASGKTTVGTAARRGARSRLPRHRPRRRGRGRHAASPTCSSSSARRTSGSWRSGRSRGRSPSTTASWPSAAARSPATRPASCWSPTRQDGGTVVWLDVDLASAAQRVGLSRDRPILGVNPRAMLRHMLETRAPAVRRGRDR